MQRDREAAPAVDAFFDKVTVNVDEPAVRENRLKLLNEIREATRAVADFSKIEGEQRHGRHGAGRIPQRLSGAHAFTGELAFAGHARSQLHDVTDLPLFAPLHRNPAPPAALPWVH